MEDTLKNIEAYVPLGLQAVAILLIVIGAIEAVIHICRVMLERHAANADKRAVWLEFARWLEPRSGGTDELSRAYAGGLIL
jgi:hypothetical protein